MSYSLSVQGVSGVAHQRRALALPYTVVRHDGVALCGTNSRDVAERTLRVLTRDGLLPGFARIVVRERVRP